MLYYSILWHGNDPFTEPKIEIRFQGDVYISYDNKLSMFLLIQEIKQKVSLGEV